MKRSNAALFALILIFNTQTFGSTVFVGYEFGQMTFNEFRNFAGEIGYSLENDSAIRLSFLNVELSERHLSSNEASAVDGDSIEGLWRGAELLYDIPITNHIYISPSVGYYDTQYSHIILDESVRNKSATAGLALSFGDNGIFGMSGLYWRFSVSFRHYFNAIQRTMLGDSVVTGGSSEVTPAIYVGYRFK